MKQIHINQYTQCECMYIHQICLNICTSTYACVHACSHTRAHTHTHTHFQRSSQHVAEKTKRHEVYNSQDNNFFRFQKLFPNVITLKPPVSECCNVQQAVVRDGPGGENNTITLYVDEAVCTLLSMHNMYKAIVGAQS